MTPWHASFSCGSVPLFPCLCVQACALHKYCWKRERAFFSRTEFRVDRMHFKNHTGCCEGYSLDSWPKWLPIVSEADIAEIRGKAERAGMALPRATAPITYDDFNSQVRVRASVRVGAKHRC